MTKQQLIDQLYEQIIADQVCPDLAESATQLVMGSGNPDAKIVLIGEAPGKSEDLRGEAFVGASGKFLDFMLSDVGLTRQDVYITNIVKYRPPNNRDPKPAEKQSFWPYLQKQLEIIDPTVIATLGRHSMEFFIPEATIGQAHGQLVSQAVTYSDGSQHQWQIIPLYHPAAALYNGSMRAVHLADFNKLTDALAG